MLFFIFSFYNALMRIRIRLDPVIFGPPDPDPVLFSTDPDPDLYCHRSMDLDMWVSQQMINVFF